MKILNRIDLATLFGPKKGQFVRGKMPKKGSWRGPISALKVRL